MRTEMPCSHFSKGGLLREIAALIDECATAFRNRGYSRQDAIGQAALALGVAPRRARALLYGEAFAASEAEYQAIKRRFAAFLDDEIESLAARSEAARAKRKQLELLGI